MGRSKFATSHNGLASAGARRTPVNITQDVENFLFTILREKDIDHTALQSEMIRNVVLKEIRDKVIHAINTRGY